MAPAKWIALLICAIGPWAPGPALAQRPDLAITKRIVSIHVCADQLALLLADPGDVVSVSYLAAQPEYSAVADLARGIPINHGRAEEVIGHDPDIVVAGRHSAGPTIAMLRGLGYRVVEIATANSLDDVRAQIRVMASAIDRVERGERIIADLDLDLARYAGRHAGAKPRAAIFHTANQTVGAGSLVNEIIELVGLENYAATLGTRGFGHLSLERLLAGEPDLLVFEGARVDRPSVGGAALRHPALKRLLDRTPSVVVPSSLWACPGPAIAEAARLLAEALP